MKFLLASSWTLLITILSLLPKEQASTFKLFDIPHLDKPGHAIFYAVFCFLWCVALLQRKSPHRQAGIYVLVFAGIYGIVIEYLQAYFSMGRQFEVWDIIANIGGAVIGFTAFNTFLK